MSAGQRPDRDRISSIRRPFLVSVPLLMLLAACGGGGDDGHPVLTPVPETAPEPVIISRDMEAGPNRFSLGLIDQSDDTQILGAELHLRFFLLDGSGQVLKFEADPEALVITKSYTHTHEDSVTETHEAGETGAYVAHVSFDTAGDWGVEITGAADGEALEPVTATFNVLEESAGLDVGDPAPRSTQRVLADVADISEIDTSLNPIPAMHDMTIAEAVSSGRPTVIVFATPAFCVSQICGPAKEIVDDLYAAYGDRANFVHVEPYDLGKARSGQALEPLPFIEQEWRLVSEPWVFIVDAGGVIAARFEGIASYEELESALIQVVSG